MERLIIDVPDQKSSLVKQLLKELGVAIQAENEINKATFRQNLLKVSVWSDDDIKVIQDCWKNPADINVED